MTIVAVVPKAVMLQVTVCPATLQAGPVHQTRESTSAVPPSAGVVAQLIGVPSRRIAKLMLAGPQNRTEQLKVTASVGDTPIVGVLLTHCGQCVTSSETKHQNGD